MPPIDRAVQWLHIALATIASLFWAACAWIAATSDDAPSGKALAFGAAMVMAGVALGAVLTLSTSARRARSAPTSAERAAKFTGPFVGSIMITSVAVLTILTQTPSEWWHWAAVGAMSLSGGFNLGIALMMLAEASRTGPDSRTPRSPLSAQPPTLPLTTSKEDANTP